MKTPFWGLSVQLIEHAIETLPQKTTQDIAVGIRKMARLLQGAVSRTEQHKDGRLAIPLREVLALYAAAYPAAREGECWDLLKALSHIRAIEITSADQVLFSPV